MTLNSFKAKANQNPTIKTEEIEEAMDIIQDLLSLSNSSGNVNSSQTLAYQKLLNIFKDVSVNKSNSSYVKWVSPFNVTTNNSSQVRQISIDTEHLQKVTNSIENLQRVTEPLLLGEGLGTVLLDLFNGVHRHKASIDLIKSELLPKEFKYPAVIIPSSDVVYLTPVIQELQNALNEKEPQKSNNSSDIQKSIETQVKRDKMNLQDEDDYDYLLEKLKILFRHHSPKSLKASLTREKNKRQKISSGVVMKHMKDFQSDMCGVFADEIQKVKPKIDGISMRGSSISQAFEREFLAKAENPKQEIWHQFVDQDQKGDSTTTIANRISYFRRLKSYYEFWGAKGLQNDKTIITPQNTDGFEYSFNGVDYETKPELLPVKDNWIIVTKDEMIKHWKSGGDVKPEWIFRS